MSVPDGTVQEVTAKKVLVFYKVVGRGYGDICFHTYFYENGHHYSPGDVYPDKTKENGAIDFINFSLDRDK